jgi:hypothetical protein
MQILYQFAGGSDGAQPSDRLVMDKAGALYGTTTGGGIGCKNFGGCGTVFRLTLPAGGHSGWSETVIYRFAGGSDGAAPTAGLIIGEHGVLYGTTFEGGGSGCSGAGCGTAFRLTPPAAGGGSWKETVLHRFGAGKDGSSPCAGLIADRSGDLFGTTLAGGGSGSGCGPSGCGIAYELTAPAPGKTLWAETVLHSFDGSDGAAPAGDLIGVADGSLYDTTTVGGLHHKGTVFELVPAARKTRGTEIVLYDFKGRSDGEAPFAGLVADGNALYGTTSAGGGSGCTSHLGCGTMFKLVP